jgi:hypothetical protein
MLRVGIVGHRMLGDPGTVRFVADQCELILRRAKGLHGAVNALSATAEGADTLFAEAAVSLQIPLDIVRPFDGYRSDFLSAQARNRYCAVRQAARSEAGLAYCERSEEAYLAAMVWVIHRSDVLVAAWDGRPALGLGGTGNAVRLAGQVGRPVIHVDVVNRSVSPPLEMRLLT